MTRGAKEIGDAGEYQVAATLEDLGFEALWDIYVPYGRSVVQIDICVLIGNMAVALEVKNWSGTVKGLVSSDEWSLVRGGGRSTKVGNPIIQNARQVAALSDYFGSGGCAGLVVLAGTARFDGRCPTGIVELARIEAGLETVRMRNVGKDTFVEDRWDAFQEWLESMDKTEMRTRHEAMLKGLA